MKQKRVVKLIKTARSQLKELISNGEAYEVSSFTVYNVRKNYTEGGLEQAILRK